MSGRAISQPLLQAATTRTGRKRTASRFGPASRVLIAMALAALVASSLATAARASDDAGLRSVFAHGAGNRALGLGGAYAALADDASAPVWNPGGLGWLERNSLYATHTNLIGMGFGEQFGSLVVPSWRLGVFSLTLRSFGVDGIEQRDDRNALLDDDLSDSETELAVGYGRRFGAAWSVGGAVKWQRQKLAGYSDSALGLDLGLMVRPLLAAGLNSDAAAALRLGLAFRNVVQPTLRLVQDDVADPTGIRFGTAWSHPFGNAVTALVTLDVEKTQYMDTRLHAGLEVALARLLALRMGSHAGDLTAGMSISWRDLTLDYAFEDNRLEPVHRVGLSLEFGSTTAARQQAALSEREQEIQERLASSFEAENRKQVDRLLRAARVSLSAWQFDEAARLISAAGVLDPTRPDLAGLEAAALRGQADRLAEAGDYSAAAIYYGRCLAVDPADTSAARGLAAVRQASDRQTARNEEMRALFAASLEAYTREDYLTARNGFSEILRRQPDDTEAAQMLHLTEQTIRARGSTLADQARALAVAGEPQQAAALLAEAQALTPGDPAVIRAQNAVTIAQSRPVGVEPSATTAGTALPTTPRVATTATDTATTMTAVRSVTEPGTSADLSAAQLSELADLYDSGMAAADAGRHDDAIGYWELVWSIDPRYQRVRDNLEREYLARGMEAFAAGDLEQAVRDWERAVQVNPADARARGYLQRALDQQSRIARFPEVTP